MVLKYIYTGKIIKERESGDWYCVCIEYYHCCDDLPHSLDSCSCGSGCLFGSSVNSNTTVNCVFNDFSKSQRLVELSELINVNTLTDSRSMTECLFEGWYKSNDIDDNDDCTCKSCPEYLQCTAAINIKYQYYVNIYKIALTVCDDGPMVLKAKNRIQRFIFDHNKEITSSGLYGFFK